MTSKSAVSANSSELGTPKLRRSLTLPLLILYGLGVTVGAGIYVLIGATASKAGIYAPVSFILASLAVAFTGLTYSELSTRYPVSAGEAAYVDAGFSSRWLTLTVGMLVAVSGIVSSATISIGAAAYLNNIVPIGPDLLTFLIIAVIGMIAVWGITQSVTIAGIFTLVEIGGLALVVYGGWADTENISGRFGELIPPMEMQAWSGIFAAGLLAFFAYIGFEDMVNVAEEVKNPTINMPRAVIITLSVSTVIYVLVTAVVILAVPLEELSHSDAPLALVFGEDRETMLHSLNIIAIVATTNGVLIQFIMVSRVLYGMANRGNLPAVLGRVNPVTKTPLIATALVTFIVLFLALFVPMTDLAEITSMFILVVFSLVNLALIRLKMIGKEVDHPHFKVKMIIPILGFVFSAVLLTSAVL